MKQQPLFEPSETCMFGVLWLDHWDAPVGTGLGCVKCATYEGEPSLGKRDGQAKLSGERKRDGTASKRRVGPLR